MSSKSKHAERSKRSSKNYIPTEMFSRKAKWKKYQRDLMKERESK